MPNPDIEATVVVRGQKNVLPFPAALEISDHSLVASGTIEIRPADIGLVPFKAFLSRIKVRDKIVLQYLIQTDRQVAQPDW